MSSSDLMTCKIPIVKQYALHHMAGDMADKHLINIRVTTEEAEILATYADAVGQTKTDVLRGYIRSLEGRLRRVRNKRPADKPKPRKSR